MTRSRSRSTISRRLGPLLALLVAARPLVGQTAGKSPKDDRAGATVGPLVRSVDVTVTNIDVVVTDSKGNRVPGLRKEDFEVVEDGLVQPLTNFFAVEKGAYTLIGDEPVVVSPAPPGVPLSDVPAPAAVPIQRTRVIIFVDNLNLTPFNRNRVLRNVQAWARETIKDNVEAMVVTWDRSLKVRRKFTNDGRDVADVLKQVEEISALRLTSLGERQQLLQEIDEARSEDQAIGRARSYALSLKNDLEFTLEALKTTVNQLAGVEGRKILLHVSEGLPQSPGAEIWQYIQDKFRTSVTAHQNFEFDKTTGYVSVIRAANAAGVTIYTMDASGLSVDAGVSAENRTTQARISSFVERGNLQSMITLMAEETGGQAILNKNDVGLSLKEIERDFSSYYSLGYRSLRSGADRPHRVEVRVKKKGLEARSRRSYVEKSAETKISESVVSALFFPRDDNPLSAGLEVGTPVPADSQNYYVPVRIRVPYARLTLLPEGPRLRGRVVFYFAVLDAQGKQSDLATQVAPIELPASSTETLAKRDFVFDSKLLMIPGGQRLSIGVRDEITNTVSYLQKSVFVSVLGTESRSGAGR